MLIGLIVLVLIGYAIYYGVTNPYRKTSKSRPKNRHLEILKERYAKGEITREQYLRMIYELGVDK